MKSFNRELEKVLDMGKTVAVVNVVGVMSFLAGYYLAYLILT